MKSLKLFLVTFLSCCCTISYAQQPSKQITDKGIFPQPSTPDEAVTPSLADDDSIDEDNSTDSLTTPSRPSGDKEYPPKASPRTPKSDKEYFPSARSPATPQGNKGYFPDASSSQNKSNTRKSSR